MFLRGSCHPPDPLLFLGGFQPPRPPGGGPSTTPTRRFFTCLLIFGPSMPFWGQGGWKMAPIYLEAFNLWVRCRRRFFFQKNGPHISGSPELVGTLPQAPFFSQKNGPHIFGSPKLVGTLPQAPFFFRKMAPYFWKPLMKN